MNRLVSLFSRYSLAGRVWGSGMLVIFLVGGVIVWRTGDDLRYRDEVEYHALAGTLKDGVGFVHPHSGLPTAFRSPGYPMVLQALYRWVDRPLAAKLLNLVALLVILALISRLAALSHPMAGALVPWMALGLHPGAIYTASTLYPQTLAALVLMGAFACLRQERIGTTILAGLLWGAGILLTPSFLLLLPVMALGCIRADRSVWQMGGRMILFATCAVLVVAPWTVRNRVVMQAWIPVSTNSGINLLLGNSDNTGPDTGVNVDLSNYADRAEGLSEVERDRFFRKAALDWVAHHPGEAGWLYVRKTLNHFNFRNKMHTKTESSHQRDAIMFVSYYSLLALALLRLFLARRFPLAWPEYTAWIVYLGNALVAALVFTRIRFRLPFDFLLLLPAAGAVVCVLALAAGRFPRLRRLSLPRPSSAS